jgi:hypothetical protein
MAYDRLGRHLTVTVTSHPRSGHASGDLERTASRTPASTSGAPA